MKSDRTPVYVDTDCGIDDAVALAVLAARTDFHVVGIGSVCGNTSSEVAARNAATMARLLNLDAPVAMGPAAFIDGSCPAGRPSIHGANGLGGVDLSSPEPLTAPDCTSHELLIRLAHEHAGRLRVLALGPLTNLATALSKVPPLVGLVHDITVMGGAFRHPGNITPLAEANISHDPEAADMVFSAEWPVTVVPLDATMTSPLPVAQLERWATCDHPVLQPLGRMCLYYANGYIKTFGRPVAPLHDAIAAALLTGALRVTASDRLAVEVDTRPGPTRGLTFADLRLRNGTVQAQTSSTGVEVVWEVDSDVGDILEHELSLSAGGGQRVRYS